MKNHIVLSLSFGFLLLVGCGSSGSSDGGGGAGGDGAVDGGQADAPGQDAAADLGGLDLGDGGDGAAGCTVTLSFAAKKASSDANESFKTFDGTVPATATWADLGGPRLNMTFQKTDATCFAFSIGIDGDKPAAGKVYKLGVAGMLASFVYQENAKCDYTGPSTLTWANAGLDNGNITFTKVDGMTWEGTFTADLTAQPLSKMAAGTFTLEGTFKTGCGMAL